MKTLVLLKPSLVTLTLEKVVCDGLRTMSGTTMCGAALNDLITDRAQLGQGEATSATSRKC